MKIKNKYLIILFFIFFAFIILSVSNKVSALTVKNEDNTVVLPNVTSALEEKNCDTYTVFYMPSENKYFLFVFNKVYNEDYVYSYPRCSLQSSLIYVALPSHYEYYLSADNSTWIFNSYNSVCGYGGVNSSYKFLYCNIDLVDQSGNVVFQVPVLTLGEVLEQTNPVQTFQTMTRGIITYLIVFLVGLVAFWKAWQLLFKELRKG